MTLSGNGLTVAVGAPQNNENGDNAGLIVVHRNYPNATTTDNWKEIGRFTGQAASDYAGFGKQSISLSKDGSILAIGTPYADPNSLSDAGHVRILEVVNNDTLAPSSAPSAISAAPPQQDRVAKSSVAPMNKFAASAVWSVFVTSLLIALSV